MNVRNMVTKHTNFPTIFADKFSKFIQYFRNNFREFVSKDSLKTPVLPFQRTSLETRKPSPTFSANSSKETPVTGVVLFQ